MNTLAHQQVSPIRNIVKDPRYGRNSELPGEDPFLTAQYAINYVKGCQQVSNKPGGKPFPKMLAYLKHYTACKSDERKEI